MIYFQRYIFYYFSKTNRLGDYNKTNDGPDCILSPDVEDCTEGETRIQIDRTIPHPQYKLNQISRQNDIGLIRMKKTAPYTGYEWFFFLLRV